MSELAEFIESEAALIKRWSNMAADPSCSSVDRLEHIAAIKGHMMRLTALEERANRTAAAARARSQSKSERDLLVDAMLAAEPDEPIKRLQPKINAALAGHGFKTVGHTYLYDRRGKIPHSSDAE